MDVVESTERIYNAWLFFWKLYEWFACSTLYWLLYCPPKAIIAVVCVTRLNLT